MEIVGKLIKKTALETGFSAKGEWKKRGFVIETQEQYSKTLYFSLFGEEKVAMLSGVNEQDNIKVFFNAESREYNGNYFTDLKAFNVLKF